MSQTLKLDHPIRWGNDPEIQELTFRRLNIGDLKMVKNPENLTIEEIISLVARSTGIDEPKIERVDLSDMLKVQEIITGFLQGSR